MDDAVKKSVKTREPRTYIVVVSYAGNPSRGKCVGCHSSRKLAFREREHFEKTQGPMALVRVFDADRMPKKNPVEVFA